ncbi:MAG TPA: AMP-binding protein [Solirubrobacteraceae bacterium]
MSWPAKVADDYRRKGYWEGLTLGALLRSWAEVHGERTALVSGEDRLSYAQLDSRVDRLAAGLVKRGIAPGERIVVQLPNITELVTVSFALFRIGALPVMALPAHRRSELSYLCDFSEAVGYVVADRYQGFDYRRLASEVQDAAPALEHVFVAGDPGEFVALGDMDEDPITLPDPDAADVALFLLSGGTTGPPKLIPRTHEDYAYNLRISGEVAGLDSDAVYLAALPAAHNFALGCPGVLGTLRAGGKAVLALTGSPDETFPLIERERVTITALVPPLALMWMDAAAHNNHDLSSLELVQVGGSKLGAEPARRIRPTLGCTLQQSFGMAEGLLSQTRADDTEGIRTISQGRPISPGDEIRVVDSSGQDIRDGGVGELLVRGPYTTRGYYRAPDYNKSVFTSDGFFRTGDLVKLTPAGNLIIEGRARDVINRGGDKIAADEVEDHLLAHPAIRGAALVAIPDDVMGERTCVCVIPRGQPPTLREIAQFLRGRGLAAYKVPDRLEVLDSFPLTGVGKVSKADLRALVSGAPSGELDDQATSEVSV